MGRINYLPINQIKKTFLDLSKKWRLMLLVILIDLVFLFVFSFTYTLYFQKIMAHAAVIMQQTPLITTALQTQDINAALPYVQELSRAVFEIKKLAILLAISTFVIWIAFQAVNWWNCFKISGRKIKYLDYLKTFTLASAIWIAIISLALYISISMFFGNALAFPNSQPQESILNIGLIIAFGIVGYFALVSYSLSGRIKEVLKKIVTFSFLKSEVLVSYIIIVIALVIINFIIYLLWKTLWAINDILVLAVGAVILLLFFVFGRVYMINVVQEIESKKRKN